MAVSSPAAVAPGARPPVSVLVPFLGSGGAAASMMAAMRCLIQVPGDELIVADNTSHGVINEAIAGEWPAETIRIVRATEEQSAYYARNLATELARNDWILFTDDDCLPDEDLLSRYFASGLAADVGAVAGDVASADSDLISRYADSRGLLGLKAGLRHPYKPTGVTANLLVRRDAWSSLGGFLEGVCSGADVDFCWRLQEAGWAFESRPDAVVRHRHRQSLAALARQSRGYGAGNAWLNRRFTGSSPAPRLFRELARSAAGIVWWTLKGQLDRARFKAIDALIITSATVGRATSNTASKRASETGAADVVIVCDCFPRLSETFIVEEARALKRLGYRPRFEVVSRPPRPALGAARGLRINYREDDTGLDRLRAFAWAIVRHPLRSLKVGRSAVRWRAGGEEVTHLASIGIPARRVAVNGETRVHAHFARVAGLDALRMGMLTGLPFSLTAHATHDIYGDPANLEEKLRAAAFVTTGCQYNIRYLLNLIGEQNSGRIHEVVMGVDTNVFARSRPLGGRRVVVAVGRLIETKGFRYLLEAVAMLEKSQPVDKLVLVGDGPLRAQLEELVASLGVQHRVEFAGAQEPAEVKSIMEAADLIAMPCVIAGDGARDSMPVVVKEAMALELMVVATDEVGLPEIVREEWGRLVPPGDSASLSAGIAELLALPLDTRAAMGAAARAFVVQHCNVDRETAKLAGLLGLTGRRPNVSEHQPTEADRSPDNDTHLKKVV